jgi:hypothetical protein
VGWGGVGRGEECAEDEAQGGESVHGVGGDYAEQMFGISCA